MAHHSRFIVSAIVMRPDTCLVFLPSATLSLTLKQPVLSNDIQSS